MIFNEDADEYVMSQKIRERTDENTWKDYVLDILIGMPDIETEIGEWVKSFSTVFCSACARYGYEISTDKKLKDIFKMFVYLQTGRKSTKNLAGR